MTDHATRARELYATIRGRLIYPSNAEDEKAAAIELIAAALDQAAQEAVKDMEQRKDAAYLERNQVVAALAKCFPSGKARTAIEGWSEDWHNCVYIDLPTGQVSWHYHDSQAYLFVGVPHYLSAWDGHSTEEKYRRLAQLQAAQPVWSKDRPKVAGWYWWRHGGCDRVRYVHSVKDNLLRVEAPDGWFDDIDTVDGEWAGPLPLPREA